MGLQIVSQIYSDRGTPPQVQHNTGGIREKGALRNEGEILMPTVSQISKAILVLLIILEGENWLQATTTPLQNREKENE